MNKPFKFKQFEVHQDRCAMKIGTDGVLLSAWTNVDGNPESILDIGAGTGIISLMLAQRCDAFTIDAIEIDEDAYEQCVDNFEASPWGDRLYCYHAGMDEFVDEVEDSYDIIVSNPPFYSEEVSSGDLSRDMARQNNSLPFDELLKGVSKLLSDAGIFSVILPYKETSKVLDLALSFGLFPMRLTQVRGHLNAAFKRTLLEFSREEQPITMDELTIELERHVYTPEYINLTKDFYLKM